MTRQSFSKILYSSLLTFSWIIPVKAERILINNQVYDVKGDKVVQLTQEDGQQKEVVVADEQLIAQAVRAQQVIDEIKAAQQNRTASNIMSWLAKGQELTIKHSDALYTALTAPAKILATAASGGSIGLEAIVNAISDIEKTPDRHAKDFVLWTYAECRRRFEENRSYEQRFANGAILTNQECEAYRTNKFFVNQYMGPSLELFEAIEAKRPLSRGWLAPFLTGIPQEAVNKLLFLQTQQTVDDVFAREVQKRRAKVKEEREKEDRLTEARKYFVLGHYYTDSGNPEKGIEMLTKATELNQNDAEYWNDLGACFGWIGKYQKALDCYDVSLSLQPNFGTALYNKSSVLRRLKKWEAALVFAKAADGMLLKHPDANADNKKFLSVMEEYLTKRKQ